MIKKILFPALLAVCGSLTSTTIGATPSPALNLSQMIVPAGKFGRHIEFPMRPTFITIHSTENPNATALQHATGMKNGSFRGTSQWNRTGFLTWHFSVDDVQAIQSLPLDIQGEHADHDGPGNKTSVGIEICEFRSAARQAAAIDRAARLAAYVMHEKGIPLDHVVPHYHWTQVHFHNNQKDCPHILLDGGKPGPRWAAFLQRVKGYY